MTEAATALREAAQMLRDDYEGRTGEKLPPPPDELPRRKLPAWLPYIPLAIAAGALVAYPSLFDRGEVKRLANEVAALKTENESLRRQVTELDSALSTATMSLKDLSREVARLSGKKDERQ